MVNSKIDVCLVYFRYKNGREWKGSVGRGGQTWDFILHRSHCKGFFFLVERERSDLPLPVCCLRFIPPNPLPSDRQRLGARNSVQVSHMSVRNPGI